MVNRSFFSTTFSIQAAAVVLLCLATLGISHSGSRFQTAAPDLLTNPSFARGLAGWEGSRGVTLDRASPGAAVLRVGDRAKMPLITQLLRDPARYQHVRVAAEVRATGIVPGAAAWQRGRIVVRFIDHKGRRLRGWPSVVASVAGTAGWRRFEAVLPVPPAAAAMRLFVYLGATGGEMRVRNLSFAAVVESDWARWATNALIVLWIAVFGWAGWAAWSARARMWAGLATFAVAMLVAVAALAPLPSVTAIETGFQAVVADRDVLVQRDDAGAIERRISTGTRRDLQDHPSSSEAWGRAFSGMGFAVVAILALFGFRRDGRIKLAVALVGAAISLEALQGLTATRVPSIEGAALNVLGAAAGLGLGLLFVARHPAATRLRRGTLWAVTGSLAGVVLAEAALWLVVPLPDPFTTATVRSVAQKQNLPGIRPDIVYSRNSFGFRSLSMSTREKRPRTIRIVALGASTTDQPAQSTEDIWSALLERRLRSALEGRGIDIEVAAYGRGGERVFHRVFMCERRLSDFAPDIVVTLEGVNDLVWNGKAGYRYSRAARFAEIDRVRADRAEVDLTSLLWRRASSVTQIARRLDAFGRRRDIASRVEPGATLDWHSRNLPALRETYRRLPYRNEPKRDPDPIVEFADGIGLLIGCARRLGSAVLVLGQPVLWKPAMSADEAAALWMMVSTPAGSVRPDPAWLRREMARYNDVQRRMAKRLGAAYLDLDTRIAKSLDNYFDDVHYTDRGNRAMADAIFPALRDLVERVARQRGLISPR